MLSYEVRRSIHIKQPQARIIEFLSDYRNWPSWSPWLIQEPDCPLIYSDGQGEEGCGYEWDGQLVGAGSMLLSEKLQDSLTMDLLFFRPFKSQATVCFEIIEDSQGCNLTWIMQSQVPWFMFFLKNMFKAWIAMDYQRGLIMLKAKLETGHVPSRVKILGKQKQNATSYLAVQGDSTLNEIGPVMQQHYQMLEQALKELKLQASGPSFALYQSMDMHSTRCQFETCYPIDKPVSVTPPLLCKTLPTMDTYTIEHKGAYAFMGNGWALAMSAARFYKQKVKRKPMGMEVYVNRPGDVADEELISHIKLFYK